MNTENNGYRQMDKKTKNILLQEIDKLYAGGKNEEIADLLITAADTREDYDLSLRLARAFIDIADDDSERFFDAAEVVLMQFYDEGFRDAQWHYQLARAHYCRGRVIEASRQLELLAAVAEPTQEARELQRVCKNDIASISSYYDESTTDILYKHITRYFGSISRIIEDPNPMGIRADIAVIEPDEERAWRTLVTVGMGAYKMDMPEEFDGKMLERAELVFYIPSDASPQLEAWACEHMRTLARLPIERRTWVSYGHLFSSGRPLCENTRLSASALINIQDADDGAYLCPIGERDIVIFYQIFPLYKEEMDYKLSNGIGALVEKMPHISAVLDLERENVCKGYSDKNNSPLFGEEIDYVSRLGIGEYCTASKKIAVEGCRVGYMRRINFQDEMYDNDDMSGNDSGWLLLSGNESSEYFANPFNVGLYKLNTICNIDVDILPFLTMPYDTEVVRNADGDLEMSDEQTSEFDDMIFPPS